MTKLQKLKAKLVEKDIGYRECADAIGMKLTTFNSKINKKSTFDIEEAKAIADFLELSDEERVDVFLR